MTDASVPLATDVPPEIAADVAVVQRISAVTSILRIVCDTTGMGFAAIGRVTDQTWTACAVLDRNGFGLQVGGQVPLVTTFCRDVRRSRLPIIIDQASIDPVYAHHETPRLYGFESYIAVPIIRSSGEVIGTICAFDPKPMDLRSTQIMPTMQMFAELVAAQIEVEEHLAASKLALVNAHEVGVLREQFIAILGHDLRNPVAAISSGLSVLEVKPLDAKCALVVRHMKQSCRRMSALISDTLDLARGRFGPGIEVEKRPTSTLEGDLGHVVDELRDANPTREILVNFNLDEPVCCDSARVSQMLSNLVANAVAHGAADQAVTVSVHSDSQHFRLSVSNSGAPIPSETMNRLFEPFSRGPGKDGSEGLGLGLFIASEIARSHGGKLTVTSDVQATTFTFTMPNNLPNASSPKTIFPA